MSPLEEGMCRSEDSVNDVEVAALETVDHLCQQVRPLLGKVFPANNADGITQLQHTEINQEHRHSSDSKYSQCNSKHCKIQPSTDLFLYLFRTPQHQVNYIGFDCRSVHFRDFVLFIFHLSRQDKKHTNTLF